MVMAATAAVSLNCCLREAEAAGQNNAGARQRKKAVLVQAQRLLERRLPVGKGRQSAARSLAAYRPGPWLKLGWRQKAKGMPATTMQLTAVVPSAGAVDDPEMDAVTRLVSMVLGPACILPPDIKTLPPDTTFTHGICIYRSLETSRAEVIRDIKGLRALVALDMPSKRQPLKPGEEEDDSYEGWEQIIVPHRRQGLKPLHVPFLRRFPSLADNLCAYDLQGLVALLQLLHRRVRAEERPAPPALVQARIEKILQSHSTCALGIASAGKPRALPVEYLWLQGQCFFISWGGNKMAELLLNNEAGATVFENTADASKPYAGVQIRGHAELIDPADPLHKEVLARKKPLRKSLCDLPTELHVFAIQPLAIDLLDASFATNGYDMRQSLDPVFVRGRPSTPDSENVGIVLEAAPLQQLRA
eukprot:jgi/Chlat1/6490/Chrsp45S05979